MNIKRLLKLTRHFIVSYQITTIEGKLVCGYLTHSQKSGKYISKHFIEEFLKKAYKKNNVEIFDVVITFLEEVSKKDYENFKTP